MRLTSLYGHIIITWSRQFFANILPGAHFNPMSWEWFGISARKYIDPSRSQLLGVLLEKSGRSTVKWFKFNTLGNYVTKNQRLFQCSVLKLSDNDNSSKSYFWIHNYKEPMKITLRSGWGLLLLKCSLLRLSSSYLCSNV